LEREAAFIDAEITRLETTFEIGPDVDVPQLIHTGQQRTHLQESGLALARPDVVVEFSRPGGYPELLELIKTHGYDLARP
jgi:dihydrodipicolinate reductase